MYLEKRLKRKLFPPKRVTMRNNVTIFCFFHLKKLIIISDEALFMAPGLH